MAWLPAAAQRGPAVWTVEVIEADRALHNILRGFRSLLVSREDGPRRRTHSTSSPDWLNLLTCNEIRHLFTTVRLQRRLQARRCI